MDATVGTTTNHHGRGGLEKREHPSFSVTSLSRGAGCTAADRREETTDEYPVGGGAGDVPMEVQDEHNSDPQHNSPAASGNDDYTKPEAESPRKPSGGSGARKKKRKKKRRDLPIPRPEVGSDENLVEIHTVWSRGRRTKGGYVVKAGDKVVRYIDSKGTVYCPEDTIYLDTKEPDQPFLICSIFGFTLKKRDTLSLVVKWFFRVSELPVSVRDHLLQDRHNEHGSGIIKDPEVKSRELFISKSNATDTFSISQLRGKCQVVHYQDIGSARAFKPSPDVFFYVLGYNPQTKRLATTQGEIRVGASHQAALPECQPDLSPHQMPEEFQEYEELRWQPNRVQDSDLFMYLQAARSLSLSIAAFAGMCDGAEPEHSAVADETTTNALDILHRFDYDTSKALQALVKCPARKSLEKKWGEEDSKHFVKGLKQYGKNFFQIKKTLLPRRQTGELIEYYYYWKKTQNAVSNRHQVKKLKKNKKTTRSSQPDVEFLDHSSVSECSDDSEDSDAGRDLKDYTCQHCFTNESKDWHHAGKERGLLCTECRLFFKKYGEARPLDGDKDGSQYLFKPVKEEDETLNGKHNMRTRRGNSAGETKGKKTERSNSTSSPDIEGVSSKLGPNSPSVASTGSCSSNEKDTKDNNNAQSKPENKNKKRRNGDLEEGKLKKSRSDSESMIDSSEASGNEDLGNEADSDDNNQDDLSASSQPSTPSSLDTEFKSAKDYIKPEPLPQSPLVGLPHPQPRPPLSATTTTTTCTATPVVTPAPVTQDSNSNTVGFSVGGRYPPSLPQSGNTPMLPVGAQFDVKPPLGLYPHPHPLAGGLTPLPARHPADSPAVSAPSSESGPLLSSGVPPPPGTLPAPAGHSVGHSVASLIPHTSNSGYSNPPSALNSATTTSTVFSSSAPSSLPAAAVSTTASTSMMTSMSSTGVTLMSSGSGSTGDGEREKKYTPPSPSQPTQPSIPPGMGGPLFAPYSFFPYGAHLGPRLGGGPPPPVPSLVPIKKEPSDGTRSECGDMKDSAGEPHTVHRPLPQTLPTSVSIQSSQSDQKLPPSHMPVPPPLTSIESSLPGGLVDRGGMVGPPDSLRDNSRETILREAREISLLGGGSSVSSNVPGDMGPRTLFPPPLTSMPPSATVTSSSMPPHALAGNIPHHLPVAMSMGQGEPSRPDPHHPSEPGSRDSRGGMGVPGVPPSLRPPNIPRVEDGGIVEEVVDDSDSDREGSTTPGPNPTPCNKEVMRSKSAFFIKVLDRGERNSCSRCDFVFKPLPSSALAKKREERNRKATSSSMTQSNSHSSRDEKPRERRVDTPPKSASVESQSASTSATPSQHGLYPDHHTTRPYPLGNPDTPALRQLSEYARPHAMGQDPQRAAYLGLPGHPLDPLSYRHLAMYPHGSRERLELELERDKRERDAREREMRERELREMELREKMKADMDLKPPGLERLLPPGANPLDPHWLELQRRMAYPGAGLPVLPPGGPGSGGANHLPGVYPPVSLAGELAAREREKLERLGVTGAHHPHLPVDLSYASVVERLSAERQQAERLGLVPPSNPEALARLQMASLASNSAAAAAMHAHTHAHTHSHTHLHLHQQQENNLAAAAAAAALAGGGGGGGNGVPTPIHPLAHHLYPHLPLAGADPMAGLPSASATATSLHPGSQPPLLPGTSREQAELLQRELYSRAYMDPALAHQLTAQAAHHEAIQRQLAMERERFGPGHLPH